MKTPLTVDFRSPACDRILKRSALPKLLTLIVVVLVLVFYLLLPTVESADKQREFSGAPSPLKSVHSHGTQAALRALARLEHFDEAAAKDESITCGDTSLRVRKLGQNFSSTTKLQCNVVYGCLAVRTTNEWDAAQRSELQSYSNLDDSKRFKDERSASLGLRNVFNSFSSLDGGKRTCAEIAPGPWTRYSVIHSLRPDVLCSSMISIDPLMHQWSNSRASPFNKKVLHGVDRLFTVDSALEDYDASEQVELLISFNALPHVQDAVLFLYRLFSLLSIGGTLVLNDNIYWDNVEETLHPIKVRWTIWHEFLHAFDVLHSTIEDRECFFAEDETKPAAGLYGESGTVYVIAKKLHDDFPLQHLMA